jgi:hypothetical protein
MFKTLQVQGPMAPGQFGAMQVSGPSSYYPTQTSTSTITDMMNSMMPMLMMFMMMAMIMPMMKGITAPAS